MDFFELVKNRESCRNFKPDSVERDKIERIIDTARLAPSACNGQPWNFYIVTNQEMLIKTRECLQEARMNKFTSNCPCFIVVSESDTNLKSKFGGLLKNHNFPEIDIGIATAHICYAAKELGLSTCIMGWFNEKKLKEYLNIKEKRIHLIIGLGYSEDKPLRDKNRKTIDDIRRYI